MFIKLCSSLGCFHSSPVVNSTHYLYPLLTLTLALWQKKIFRTKSVTASSARRMKNVFSVVSKATDVHSKCKVRVSCALSDSRRFAEVLQADVSSMLNTKPSPLKWNRKRLSSLNLTIQQNKSIVTLKLFHLQCIQSVKALVVHSGSCKQLSVQVSLERMKNRKKCKTEFSFLNLYFLLMA